MHKRLSQLASELEKLELEFADAGFEEQADQLGEGLELVQGILEDLSALAA